MTSAKAGKSGGWPCERESSAFMLSSFCICMRLLSWCKIHDRSQFIIGTIFQSSPAGDMRERYIFHSYTTTIRCCSYMPTAQTTLSWYTDISSSLPELLINASLLPHILLTLFHVSSTTQEFFPLCFAVFSRTQATFQFGECREHIRYVLHLVRGLRDMMKVRRIYRSSALQKNHLRNMVHFLQTLGLCAPRILRRP